MIQANLSPHNVISEDDRADYQMADHLHMYEFALRLIEHKAVKPAADKRHKPPKEFVLAMIDRIGAKDAREREYLKTLLHGTYGKYMHLRPYTRRIICARFARHKEGESPLGIPELLEVMGSIINGYNTPLKEEHKQFMREGLFALWLVRVSTGGDGCMYEPMLLYCIRELVSKDPTLLGEARNCSVQLGLAVQNAAWDAMECHL